MSGISSQYVVATAFSAVSFANHLRTSQLGRFLVYRTSVESTQTIAKREILEGAPTGTIVLSEEQTAGRGRIEGRKWKSENAGNLFCTLILRPKQAEVLASLNLAIATSIAESIRELFALPASVKWPNDVWINGKKISGVLIDAEFIGSSIAVAAGMGINVNEDWSRVSDSSINGTSIRTALSETQNRSSHEQPLVDRELLLAAVMNRLEQLITLPFSSVLARYSAVDCLTGKRVTVMPKRLEDTTSHYDAMAVGYNDQGYLMVQRNENEQPYPLIAEEVTIRLS